MVDQSSGELRVRVRYFAAARDLAGRGDEHVVLPRPELGAEGLLALLADRHPALAAHIGRMRLAINGDFADPEATVRAGDEVDLLPPVAGGSDEGPVRLCALRDALLSVDECMAAVAHPAAGATCVFAGTVRDHAEGRSVSRLDYEAHPQLADEEMRRVLEAVAAEVPEVRLAATHRVGRLAIGDLAVVVAASAPHRAEAFRAAQLAIERIKATVPIWKKEWDAAGEAHWVNLHE